LDRLANWDAGLVERSRIHRGPDCRGIRLIFAMINPKWQK